MNLSFRGVTRTFFSVRGRVAAVCGVDLDVAEGELFVLLGPSGCGKSTLLNLAAGLVKPTSGEIRFGETVVASRERKIFVPPTDRNVAMVFQSYALYPHLTVFENIAFPLRVAGERKADADDAVVRTAETLGIADLLRARPAELSGGQRQRVAIARAIVRKPALFLLDEPLSNLDAGLRASTRGELKRLQRELGVTTLYVTHDQTEAMGLGDRIALLRDGRIVQTGTPEDLYERPETPFAARFVGAPPMNLVPASLHDESDGTVLRVGEIRLALAPEGARQVGQAASREVVAGIRPERIRVGKTAGAGGITGTVAAVEPLGREALLHVLAGGHRFSVLSADKSIREGDAVALDIPADAVHVFRAKDA